VCSGFLVGYLLLALAVVTIAPIQFRPVSPLPTQLERASALATIGFVFALAYPRRTLFLVLLLLTSTTVFEALQLVEPSRHGRFLDLAVKLIGAVVGVVADQLPARLWRQKP